MGYADIPCRTVPHRTGCTYVGAVSHRVPGALMQAQFLIVPGALMQDVPQNPVTAFTRSRKNWSKNTLCKI